MATARLISIDDLAAALDLGPRNLITLIGGGGKTTTLSSLGTQLGSRTILTTTTKMGRSQLSSFPLLTAPDHNHLAEALADSAVVVRSRVKAHKALGVDPSQCDDWFADPELADHVVVEADGARRRPFKAPRPLEPVFPAATTMVVVHMGADALGHVIADGCFRPLRVAGAAGCSPYDRLTPERAATVIMSDRGSRANLPPHAEFRVVITKVNDDNESSARAVADALPSSTRPLLIATHDRNLSH